MSQLKTFMDSLTPMERRVAVGVLLVFIGLALLVWNLMLGCDFANGRALGGLSIGFTGVYYFVTGIDRMNS